MRSRRASRISNTLQSSISDIITYLFEEYGELSPDELLAKEDEVKAYVYDTSQPVSVIFNEIMTLRNMYELAVTTLSEATMMRIAYSILNQAHIFKDYLLTWNNATNVVKIGTTFRHTSAGHIGTLKRSMPYKFNILT